MTLKNFTAAPPSYALAAKVYAEELTRACEDYTWEAAVTVAVHHTMERTGLSEGKVRLASRLAREMP